PEAARLSRVVMAAVYSVLCAWGVLGNLLALLLLRSRRNMSPVTVFILNLALTDFQLALTLPFWATDTARDFNWPFGRAMCKLVSSVSCMNMYASVSFLSAMSVARYRSVTRPTHALPSGRVSALIWLLSLLLTLPHAAFCTTLEMSGEELCVLRFPQLGALGAQTLLGLYQAQKVLLGFVLPLLLTSASYLLLLRFLARQKPGPHSAQRRSQVTRTVSALLLCFFLCWLPNQVLTAWGVFVKLDWLPFTGAFYTAQAYVFPVTVCLAHTNSCLNPVLYCLTRSEFRATLRGLLCRRATPTRK
ncbi:hypothetical protein FKM82_014995, partial [Ascaphus truei]